MKSQTSPTLSIVAGLRRSFGSAIGIQLLSIITGVILARSLGPEGRGELAAIILWPTMLALIGDLGTGDAATYFSARSFASRPLLRTLLGLGLLQALAVSAIGWVLLPYLLSNQEQAVINYARAYLVFIPINIALLSALGIINGWLRYSAYHALRFFVFASTAVIFVVLVLASALNIETALVTYIGVNVLTTAISIGYIYRRPPAMDSSGSAPAPRPLARLLIGYGLRAQASTVPAALNERVDQLLLVSLVAPALLGLYVVSVTLTSATLLVGTAVSLVALPALAASTDPTVWRRLASLLVGYTLAVSVVVSAVVILLVPALIQVFFGSAFSAAAPTARILLLAAVFLGMGRLLAGILKGIGRPSEAGIGSLIGLTVVVVAVLVLTGPFGIEGAAVAACIGYGAGSVVMWLYVRRHLRLTLKGVARSVFGDVRTRLPRLVQFGQSLS